MVNSHYIPQLILRNFCVDNNIQYCDIENRKTQSRTTRSVFSEQGYYPDELERDLCEKIESQFANLLNNKLLKERYNIVLSAGELLTLKKYLIITIIRYKTDEFEHELALQGLSAEEIESIKGNFYENINKILACNTQEELFDYCDLDYSKNNLNLFSYVKDIVQSYIVFVKSNNCKEDFVIPDKGWASYEGPFHVEKLTATLDIANMRGNPWFYDMARMLTPHDYSIFPLSRNMAVMSMSVFFRLFFESAILKSIGGGLTLSQILGFKSASKVIPPIPKDVPGRGREYHYAIQQLSKSDVVFFNSLLLDNAEQFFAYADKNSVRQSINAYGKYDFALAE